MSIFGALCIFLWASFTTTFGQTVFFGGSAWKNLHISSPRLVPFRPSRYTQPPYSQSRQRFCGFATFISYFSFNFFLSIPHPYEGTVSPPMSMYLTTFEECI